MVDVVKKIQRLTACRCVKGGFPHFRPAARQSSVTVDNDLLPAQFGGNKIKLCIIPKNRTPLFIKRGSRQSRFKIGNGKRRVFHQFIKGRCGKNRMLTIS